MLRSGNRPRRPAGEFRLDRRAWLQTAALGGVTAGLLAGDSGGKATVPVKGPPLEVRTLEGKTIQIHKQTGKVVLLDFMTTTCPSCKQASAGIQKLYLELGGKGFLPVVIAIDTQASGTLLFYRDTNGLTYPVCMLRRDEVLRYLSHPADQPMYVPTLVLLDRQGRISMKQVGWRGEQELRSTVARLLARPLA